MNEASSKIPDTDIRKFLRTVAVSLLSFIKNHKELFFISLLWIGMAILSNPVGEFPLTDDWVYSRSVLTLLTNMRLELSDASTALAVTHIFWGTLFAKLFGFSMTTLRISVLVLGLAGLWITHRFFKSLGTHSFLSFWGVLTLATTPLYFGMADSFLTDITFYVFAVFSYFFFIRYLQREKNTDLIAGILLMLIAAFTRQLALIIPISFSLAYLTHKGLGRKSLLRIGVVCVVSLGTFLIFNFLLKSTCGLPLGYITKWGIFKDFLRSFGTPFFAVFISAMFWRASVNLVYLGFFLFPLLLLSLPSQWRLLSFSEKIICVGITLFHCGAAIFFGWFIHRSAMMPSGINYINDFAFGPITIIGDEVRTPAPPILWMGVTFLGMLGAGIILSNLLIPFFRFLRNFGKPHAFQNAWVWVLCVSSCFFYFLPFGLSGMFDRYIIFYMPFVMLLVLANAGEVSRKQLHALIPLSAILLLLIGFYSVAGTHDYLEWNRIRWGILRGLMQEKGISPREIDGGYEFNGWYLFPSRGDAIRNGFGKSSQNDTNKSWWFVDDDKYVVSFKMLPNYQLLQLFPCSRWLPPYKAPPLLLLRRFEKT